MRCTASVAVFRPDCTLLRRVSALRLAISAPARALSSPARAASCVTARAARAASSAAARPASASLSVCSLVLRFIAMSVLFLFKTTPTAGSYMGQAAVDHPFVHENAVKQPWPDEPFSNGINRSGLARARHLENSEVVRQTFPLALSQAQPVAD